VLFAFVKGFGLLLASFLLWSFASTLTSGADLALLFETLKGANREAEYERLTGWATALNWGGVGVATLIGGPLAAIFGIRFTIFVGAATCLVTAGVALAIPEPRHVVVHGEARRGSYFGAIRGAFGELWRQADVRALVLLAGTTGAALEAVTYLTQPYLVDRGIDVGVMFSLLQVPIFMAGIAGALLAGRARNPGMVVRTLVLVPVAGVFALRRARPGAGADGLRGIPARRGVGLFDPSALLWLCEPPHRLGTARNGTFDRGDDPQPGAGRAGAGHRLRHGPMGRVGGVRGRWRGDGGGVVVLRAGPVGFAEGCGSALRARGGVASERAGTTASSAAGVAWS
jgi:MFS family permease